MPEREQLTTKKPNRMWGRKLILLSVATVFSAIMAESLVRLAKPGFLSFEIPQVEHRPAKGIGFEMIPNQQAFTFAELATIDSRGLRNPLREAAEPVDQRVMCLGDSITFGVAVGDDIPYPRQLERLLQARNHGKTIEVINCGVQRYSTYQEIDYLRQSVRELSPDVVTLSVYFNDLAIRPEGDYIEEYENEREQVASSFRKRAPWIYLLIKKSATIELTKQVYLGWKHGDRTRRQLEAKLSEREEEKWAAMAMELQTFHELSQEHGFQPLVVTIPARLQVQSSFPNSRFPKRVLEICKELQLPVVNVHQRFLDSLQSGVDPYLEWDNHMSATGHQIVAEVLSQQLLESDGR